MKYVIYLSLLVSILLNGVIPVVAQEEEGDFLTETLTNELLVTVKEKLYATEGLSSDELLNLIEIKYTRDGYLTIDGQSVIAFCSCQYIRFHYKNETKECVIIVDPDKNLDVIDSECRVHTERQ